MTINASDPDEYLTTEELAHKIRTPIDTVRYWRAKGIGPRGMRVGRKVLYPRHEVEAWLADKMRAEHGRDAR